MPAGAKAFGPVISVWLLLLAMLLTVHITLAGPVHHYLRQADKAFAVEDYALAAELYARAVEADPQSVQANYKLGIAYLELRLPKKAKLYFVRVQKLDPRIGEKLLLYLADACQQDYDFASAKTYYQQELLKTGRNETMYRAQLAKRLEECAAGEAMAVLPPLADVVNAGPAINSRFADYVPVLLPGDSVLPYTSRRPTKRKFADAAGVEQVRISRQWQHAWQPSTLFLDTDAALPAQAMVSAAADGQELYTFFQGKGLYRAQWQQNGWTKPEPLGAPFNKGGIVYSLAVTADGRFAFFSSDRPGGMGGLDLYMSYRQEDGSWSEALNLGPSVNTPYDEDAPFVDAATNTLYFSSRGHNSMGGFDIFRSTLQQAVWAQAQNLGLPVNSPQDDVYFTLSADRNTAYFSSDRPGGFGAKDIYQIIFRK